MKPVRQLIELAAKLSFAALVAMFAGGCGPNVRCLQWNGGEGACPAPSSAARTFREVGSSCEALDSVDSDAEFDGESCCYEVTEHDDCSDAR